MEHKECGKIFRDYFDHLSECNHCAEMIYWAVGNVAAYAFRESLKKEMSSRDASHIARTAATEFLKWTKRTDPPALSDSTVRDWPYIGNPVKRQSLQRK